MLNSNFNFLVFGANGQDGLLMTRYLLKKKYYVVAVVRKKSPHLTNLKKRFKKKIKIYVIKQYDKKNFSLIFKSNFISKIFFFAGFSRIPSNLKENKKCYKSNYLIFKYFIDFLIINKLSPKILYISSSEIFGSNQLRKKNEKSIINPSNYL